MSISFGACFTEREKAVRGGSKNRTRSSCHLWLFLVLAVFAGVPEARADVNGTILGTVADPTGAFIVGANVTLSNHNNGVKRSTTTDGSGSYQFLLVPVGEDYEVEVEAAGFQKSVESRITLQVNQSYRADFRLLVGTAAQSVEVSAAAVQIETASTQLGDVIDDKKMTTLPLNGRSYIDLLGLQAGVIPVTSSHMYTGSNGFGAGSVGGNLSVNGNRETANGFMVNGGDVNEGLLDGALIIPNLDSIQEFRLITNSFDAEYGRFSGSVVNVITKSGTNQLHGTAFEFLRNDKFDARGFFDPSIAELRQNQFGGTVGGHVIKDRLFFFTDYQGTRQVVGDTTFVQVPSLAERGGNFSDVGITGLGSLTGVVQGSNVPGSGAINQVLSARLGYSVNSGEPYWTPGCTTLQAAQNGVCVFPNQVIPQSAWGPVAKAILKFIPDPNLNEGGRPIFASSAFKGTTRDDKFAERIDLNTRHTGNWSFYYHFDDSTVGNPYAGGNVPGFGAVNALRGQQANMSNIHVFGPSAVNEARLNFTRKGGYAGEATGGFGKIADFGFQEGGLGIIPLVPKFEGLPDFSFNQLGLSFGLNTYYTGQFDDTYQAVDNFSKIVGRHTLKFGGDFRYFQLDIRAGCNPNGSFGFSGNQTGNDFADFLIGTVASNAFLQCTPPALDTRGKFGSIYAQDSFKVKPNLTLNYGLRWEFSPPWFDTQGRVEQIIWGEESKIYPDSPTGWVFPGDPGVPNTLAPARYGNVAPRVGLAYSPGFSDGVLSKIFGGPGQTSIRAAFGTFYTAIEDLTMNYEIGVPPFAAYFLNPTPVYLETPFKSSNGSPNPGQRFPYTVPRPGSTGFWEKLLPLSDDQVFAHSNVLPYAEDFNFNIQRSIHNSAVLTVSYVGTRGHHLLASQEWNPGNSALCLQVRAILGPAQGCGPYGEDQIYNLGNGQVVDGTRPHSVTSGRYVNQGVLDFGNVGALATVGNSNYNAMEITLEKKIGAFQFLGAYTWSKSLGDSSFLTDTLNPFNAHLDKSLSAFDMTHNFVVSYVYNLPVQKVIHSRTGPLYKFLNGWEVAGITRFSTGQPIFLSTFSENSLTGSYSVVGVDEPNYNGQSIQFFNPRASSSHQYFSTSQFSPEPLGSFGTANQAFFHGPGLNNWDLSLHKSTPITERLSLSFRAELFNTFNHAQFFGCVSGTFGSARFGDATCARPPRIGQLALKLTF
jgi:hypothetical protein